MTFYGMQAELQVLQTSLVETKCQILQALAGAMVKPASKQIEVMQVLLCKNMIENVCH